jgi:hypothetical protein
VTPPGGPQLGKSAGPQRGNPASIKPETCNEVVDKFIAYCELRVSKDDMAPSTLEDYEEVLDRVIRPQIGTDLFAGVI